MKNKSTNMKATHKTMALIGLVCFSLCFYSLIFISLNIHQHGVYNYDYLQKDLFSILSTSIISIGGIIIYFKFFRKK